MKRILSLGAAMIALSVSAGSEAAAVYDGTYLGSNDSLALMQTITGNSSLEFFARRNSPSGDSNGSVSASLFTTTGINPASTGGTWSYAGFSSGGFTYSVTHFVIKAGNDFAVYEMDPVSATYANIPWTSERLFVGQAQRARYCYGVGAQGTILLNPSANAGTQSGNSCNGSVVGFPANPTANNPNISHISWYGVRLKTTHVSEPATLALMGAGLLGLAALRRRKSA